MFDEPQQPDDSYEARLRLFEGAAMAVSIVGVVAMLIAAMAGLVISVLVEAKLASLLFATSAAFSLILVNLIYVTIRVDVAMLQGPESPFNPPYLSWRIWSLLLAGISFGALAACVSALFALALH